MKKFILFLLLVSFFSCNNVDLSKPKYQPIIEVEKHIDYGEDVEDFLDIAGDRAELDYHTSDYLYYKIHQYNKDDKIVHTVKYTFAERTSKCRGIAIGCRKWYLVGAKDTFIKEGHDILSLDDYSTGTKDNQIDFSGNLTGD